MVPLNFTLLPALLGLGTGLSLIVAIGAQNTYLLRLGVVAARRVVLSALLLCALSDAVLITAGTLGVGAIIQRAPDAMEIVRVVGAVFLLTYGALAAKRALRPGAKAMELPEDGEGSGIRFGTAIATIAAFTWLNPHAYLDTVVFLGSLASQQAPAARWWWVGGAIFASFLWFAALGFGTRFLRPLFAKPIAWRILDGVTAAMMIGIAVELVITAV
ncbi:LysE/ArgO family amino acid transporter [Gryllotalpicola reticulitermitis]|uniref:LysE/ArgO family amino acid transporter n=1 Tax=Gryllotalpicola reticulitermitis TaxID=1184153 RepID=A0ABV8Q4Z5_9MICO